MRRASRAIIIKDGKLLVTKRNKFGSKYYILVGGGVDIGETLEQALARELQEETGVQVANPRLVFTENSGIMYGLQHIFLCDYVSGDPALHPDSAEAKISALGLNTYEPMWLSLEELATVSFRTDRLRRAIIDGVKFGFPDEPVDITDMYQV
jgi:ADP-ribose pyrophosphatase YjhB (NUDIX family)